MKRIAIAALAALPFLSASARTYEWSWRMPGSVYQNLEFSLRAGVDRATKVFHEAYEAQRRGASAPDLVPRFRAAADEWKKVQIQAEAEGFDESVLAYVIFMQGYALSCAHDRNKAVKMLAEVVDLYPDEKWIGYAARYWLGKTRLQMGDQKAGNADLDELIELAGEADDTILACAYLDRVGSLWNENREEESIELAKRGDRRFRNTNYYTWDGINGHLAFACTVRGDFEGLRQALYNRNDEKDPKKQLDARANAVTGHVNWYLNSMRYSWVQPQKYFHDKYPKESDRKAQLQKFNQRMTGWIRSTASLYDEAGRPFEAEVHAFRSSVCFEHPKDIAQQAERIRAGILRQKDDKYVNRLLRETAWTLATTGSFDLSRPFADATKGAAAAAQLRWDTAREAGKWKDGVLALEELIPLVAADPGRQRDLRYSLGWAYRDAIGDQQKAIRVYREIEDPPRQLWEISTAYRRAKMNKEAYAALNEIASMFPKDAPDAIWRIAEWREQDGEKQKAIALYRRLLSQPEWKKSAASSRAHQALERLGIATGGAVVNTVR